MPIDQWEVAEPLLPLEGDILITKHRLSAFEGTDLEMLLRANGITHLILTGISTSGVVLSTLRQAADKDYRITLLSDGCADGDEDVHFLLVTKIFPRQAAVLTIEDWLAQGENKDSSSL